MGKTSQVVQPAASRGATWLMPIAAGGPMALMIPAWAYGRKAGATTLLFGIPHGKYVHVPVYSVCILELKSLVKFAVGVLCLRRVKVQSKA